MTLIMYHLHKTAVHTGIQSKPQYCASQDLLSCDKISACGKHAEHAERESKKYQYTCFFQLMHMVGL